MKMSNQTKTWRSSYNVPTWKTEKIQFRTRNLEIFFKNPAILKIYRT